MQINGRDKTYATLSEVVTGYKLRVNLKLQPGVWFEVYFDQQDLDATKDGEFVRVETEEPNAG